ncbi:unnamed protein product [Bursaphelenchus okinawaensis]|uniref:Uncharacterized protein n=1 Tax=Bursaphelenchus okinawaensis TaxID=465554 RepID=A0A811LTE0_9BILA|nr:unnamed protein product [Bursaphelenchus okinawaensis]CAG9128573.1 unnamed protein product [Bursaphelenchus okinawaensis]
MHKSLQFYSKLDFKFYSTVLLHNGCLLGYQSVYYNERVAVLICLPFYLIEEGTSWKDFHLFFIFPS